MAEEMESSITNEEALTARNLPSAQNTPELYKAHLQRCKGKVRTRFPPEPNGFLHVGHAKSMNMNFQMAFEKLGVPGNDRECYFRYDDTNPEKESQEYIKSIADDVEWMGWKPTKVTFTSDYFDKLYDLAVEMIKRGKAYVCHQTGPEIEKSREIAKLRVKARKEGKTEDQFPQEPYLSPYRNRSVEENLKYFEDMRKGKFDEGTACLRMKMDMDSENYNFYDLVAYRIKFCPHPHIGDRWCIYPTYDYTHCIIDSLEDIEYSICTLEFETRRESYYWVLDVLDLYRPKVYEFARLNLTHVALSKRKLLKLVVSGYMRSWDDPRMPTIKGLRRRGYTSKMLNDFCQSIGVTRNKTLIQYDRLQNQARAELNLSAPRTMAVLNPIKLVITNLPANHKETISVPLFPFDKESKNREAVFSSIVYIDAKDFRENGDSNYFGLTPGGCLGLRYTNAVVFKELVKGDDGQIIEIRVEADVEKKSSPKAWVHWVSDLNKKECEIRLYNHLFVPEVVDDANWEDQLNPNSEVVITRALVDSSIGSPAAGQHYQFEREGYFVVDRDSTSNKLVFNQTVSLSEAVSKKKESDSSNSRKLDMIKQVAEKQKKMSIDPKEMFKSETDKYSQFDEDGVPTHDAEGAPLAKSGIKKLRKEWEKQKRLFEQGTVPENWKNLVKDEE